MVIYVVKNASRPFPGEPSPVPDRKRFSFKRSYCNSAGRVMQVISARTAAHELRRNRQGRRGGSRHL